MIPTLNISIEAGGERLPLGAVIKHRHPDLVSCEDDVWPRAALAHPVAAPLGLEPVILSLDGDVGTLAVHCEGCREVLEGHQQVEVPLGLQCK